MIIVSSFDCLTNSQIDTIFMHFFTCSALWHGACGNIQQHGGKNYSRWGTKVPKEWSGTKDWSPAMFFFLPFRIQGCYQVPLWLTYYWNDKLYEANEWKQWKRKRSKSAFTLSQHLYAYFRLQARNMMPSSVKQLRFPRKELRHDERLNFKFNKQRWNAAEEMHGLKSNCSS